jgi:uncharacterized alkaline shock family protein YloU
MNMSEDVKVGGIGFSNDTEGSTSATLAVPTRRVNGNLIEKPDAGAMIHAGEDGNTTISPQVVAKIAGLAIREIDGVHHLAPFGAGQQVAALAKTVTRGDIKDMGVQVEVGTKEVAVDTRIVTNYGASIPQISEDIRRNVTSQILTMTGLQVVQINVDVVDLYFPEEEENAAVETSTVRRVE